MSVCFVSKNCDVNVGSNQGSHRHTYIHIYIHTYIHTYVQTHNCVQTLNMSSMNRSKINLYPQHKYDCLFVFQHIHSNLSCMILQILTIAILILVPTEEGAQTALTRTRANVLMATRAPTATPVSAGTPQ